MDSTLGRATQRLAASPTFGKLAPHLVPQLDRFLHRVSGGRIMLTQALMPGVVLTTTGAKTGQRRETPLLAIPLDDVLYVVGSNYGGEKHPAWSTNLIANPEASVNRRREDHRVEAHRLSAQEKADIWPRLTAIWPPFDDYTERSGRDLRVFCLSRTDGGSFT